MPNWREELLGQTGAAGGAMPFVDKDAWERIDYGAQDSRLKELLGQTGAPAGALGGAYSNMSGMLNPPAETISEMMIEEKGPMPDEFGFRTPVPSSDEEAVKQDLRRFLFDGTEDMLRRYIEMNIGDLKLLAQTDNAFAKDLEAALRRVTTGDQPFQTAPGYALGGQAKSPQTVSETMMAQNTSGGVPPGEARLLEQFNLILNSGSDDLKRDFINRHMDDLLKAAEKNPSLLDRIQDIIIHQTNTSGAGAGQLIAPPRMDEYTVFEDPDIPWSPNTRDAWAGMGSSFPGPSFFPSKGQTAPDFQALEEARGTVPGMQGYAHGGYVRGRGRGTMPGELHPKGSLSVRVAGESMGEYKKHREDEDDVRPVRRTLDNALSPTLSRRMFS